MAAQRSNAHAPQHSPLIVRASGTKCSRSSSSAVHLVECDRAVVSLRQSYSSHAVLIDVYQYYSNLGSMCPSSSELHVSEIIDCYRGDNGCKQSDGAETMTQHLLGGQVLRQILEDHSARDSNSEDSFLADVMYSLAQGQAGVNNDKLTEDAHANDFSPAPLFDDPSTSQGTSNAAAFGCVITRAFVEAANDNDDSSDSEADRAPKTFAQLFEEMRSRAMSREAQSGTSTKRGSSPHSGFVKNKSASAVTNVSGKRQNNECGHSDDVMSKRAKDACSNCYRTFSTASNLQRHERGHVGEKAYTCVKFNMSFSRAQGLSEHTNSHDGVKPHVCNACEKAFDTKRKLTQHAKTHAENRAYSCVTCGQAFKQKTTLYQHMIVHSDERPFVCKVCGAAFKRKEKLMQHKKRAGHVPDGPIN